jgi:hypothetical protein
MKKERGRFLFQFLKLNGVLIFSPRYVLITMTKIAVKKHAIHHLNQVIKVNIASYHMYEHHATKGTKLHFHDI